MLLSNRLSLSAVIALCRALRHNLAAGLTLVHVFRQQSERGPAALRPLAGRVLEGLQHGESLSVTLDGEKSALPPLFLAMVEVGEESGHLAEIFGELEKHYILQEKLGRQFRSQAMLPVIQLFFAFLLIAGLIFILGMLAPSNAAAIPIFGLRGATGAVLFLVLSFGSVGLLWLGGRTIGRLARRRPAVDAFLLRLPGVGPCLEAVVMGRFTTALHMTLDSGMPIVRALKLDLRATDNAAFTAQSDTITSALKLGEPLTEALTRARLFSADFLAVVAVGEEGGRVPEVMRHQAEYYNEEAGRRLVIATRLLGFLVWLVYAIFMIWAIFSVGSVYFGMFKL